MPWHCVHRVSDGEAVSLTTVLPGVLPVGLASVVVADPDGSWTWDRTTKATVPTVPAVLVDRILDLVGDASLAAMWTRLTAAQQTALRDRLALLLGSRRFRPSSEPINLDV